MSLTGVLQRRDIWRGGEHNLHDKGTTDEQLSVPTGYATLDAELPDGGWPLGALTELLPTHNGGGELRLLLPALARLSASGRWLAWVAPPYLPYAPALARAGVRLERLLLVRPSDPAEGLWALEQCLRSGACAAVIGWPEEAESPQLRRLQLAAEAGQAMGILFRPPECAGQSSPAALRLRLEPTATGLRVDILKCRGGWSRQAIELPA